MARIRTARVTGFLAAAPLAASLLFACAGAAHADNGSFASHGSNSSVVSNARTGNLFGWVNGNYNWTQQTATGPGASNQNNTVGVKGNSGVVYTDQSSRNVRIVFAPIFFD